MKPAYPVTFDIIRPERYDRAQIALRLVGIVVLSIMGVTVGRFFGLLYLVLPILAAIFISTQGSEGYLCGKGARVARVLNWIMAIAAYYALLTDRFPMESPETFVRFEVQPEGKPTIGSALLRLLYSLPGALLLIVLWFVGAIGWFFAAILILAQRTYPEGLFSFQCGVLRWQARLLAYHASLVDRHPPIRSRAKITSRFCSA